MTNGDRLYIHIFITDIQKLPISFSVVPLFAELEQSVIRQQGEHGEESDINRIELKATPEDVNRFQLKPARYP